MQFWVVSYFDFSKLAFCAFCFQNKLVIDLCDLGPTVHSILSLDLAKLAGAIRKISSSFSIINVNHIPSHLSQYRFGLNITHGLPWTIINLEQYFHILFESGLFLGGVTGRGLHCWWATSVVIVLYNTIFNRGTGCSTIPFDAKYAGSHLRLGQTVWRVKLICYANCAVKLGTGVWLPSYYWTGNQQSVAMITANMLMI